jgi:hypothetical protein
MLHNSNPDPYATPGDTFVPISGSACPQLVVLERSCSVYAASLFWLVWRDLYGVKVKLTMGLGFPAKQLISAHFITSTSPVFSKGRRDGIQGGFEQIWLSRGEGWGFRVFRFVGQPTRREKRAASSEQGRAFSEPSLFFVVIP